MLEIQLVHAGRASVAHNCHAKIALIALLGDRTALLMACRISLQIPNQLLNLKQHNPEHIHTEHAASAPTPMLHAVAKLPIVSLPSQTTCDVTLSTDLCHVICCEITKANCPRNFASKLHVRCGAT